MAENWIKGAIRKPGSFRAAAKEHGESTHGYAEQEKDKGGKVGKRARLALTLMKLNH